MTVNAQPDPVQFRFKGTRDYVQGPDLFNALVAIHRPEALRNIRFTVHGFVRNAHCEMFHARSREALADLADVKARASFDRDGVPQWVVLKESSTPGPVQRTDYDEARVVDRCEIRERSAVLMGASPYTFIETIVSMNKHLHQSVFPDAVGKWIFTGIDLGRGCAAREDLALRLGSDPNVRLTRAQIVHQGQPIGSLFFSLTKP